MMSRQLFLILPCQAHIHIYIYKYGGVGDVTVSLQPN